MSTTTLEPISKPKINVSKIKKAVKKASLVKKTEKLDVIVHPFGGNTSFAEISQSMNTRFSLLHKEADKEFTEITGPVKCVDFICDTYTATKQKAEFSIYGYSWDGVNKSPDMDEMRLYVRLPNQQSYDNFINQLSIIHSIEDKNNIPRTVFLKEKEHRLVVIGNVSWMANCLTMRLYLFMLRIIGYNFANKDNWLEELRDMSVSDGNYAKSVPIENWNRILDDLNSIKNTGSFCGLSFKKHGTSALHHNAGFFSQIGGSHSEINTSTVVKSKHFKVLKERGFTYPDEHPYNKVIVKKEDKKVEEVAV